MLIILEKQLTAGCFPARRDFLNVFCSNNISANVFSSISTRLSKNAAGAKVWFLLIRSRIIKIKNQIFLYSFLYWVDVTSWRSPSPQLAPRQTMESCIAGKSMVTSVNLIHSLAKTSTPRASK